MSANSRKIDVLHCDDTGKQVRAEETVCEFFLQLFVNNLKTTTFRCSPDNLEALVTGFLASEGMIRGKKDIKGLAIDEESGIAAVRTTRDSVKNRETTLEEMNPDMRLTRQQVLSLYRRFQESSVLHRETNAAHSAALCRPEEIVVFAEDIGRHNAVDRVIGECIRDGLSPAGMMLLVSCRVSSEIVTKAAAVGIPVLISKSAPTDRGIERARSFGMTLIGFVYRSGMNIYTGEKRMDI